MIPEQYEDRGRQQELSTVGDTPSELTAGKMKVQPAQICYR